MSKVNIIHPPLTREMWQHKFSAFDPEQIREGLMSRSSVALPGEMLDTTTDVIQAKGLRITGLQKVGIPADTLVADIPIDLYSEGYRTAVQYPIRDTLDFMSGSALRGNFELGSDANDFLASEYGKILQADPFRDPRHQMLDAIREKQYPDRALSRQDLANRFFLQQQFRADTNIMEVSQPDIFRQQQQENLQFLQEALDSVDPLEDRAQVTLIDHNPQQTKRRVQQYNYELDELAIAEQSTRYGTNPQAGSLRTPLVFPGRSTGSLSSPIRPTSLFQGPSPTLIGGNTPITPMVNPMLAPTPVRSAMRKRSTRPRGVPTPPQFIGRRARHPGDPKTLYTTRNGRKIYPKK